MANLGSKKSSVSNVFTNDTVRGIKSFFRSLRIIDEKEEAVQTTGF